MAGRLNMALCMTLLVASMLHVSLAQMAPSPTVLPPSATPAPVPSRAPVTHIVGDGLGWTVPPGVNAYQTWARGQTFNVGDILVFNFATGAHDVAEVSRTGYDSCNTNPNSNIITNGPARITLTAAGEQHYICNIPSHCSLGQRLAINVTAGGATSMPPSSTTPASQSPGSAPPPPDSSAPAIAAKALPFTFLAVALAFLY